MEIDIELKPGAKIIEQKGRPIPIHLQDDVERELERLIRSGHLEKAKEIDENCFVSPAVITVKKDKSVKIALDSRKLNEITIKKKEFEIYSEQEYWHHLIRYKLRGSKDAFRSSFYSPIDWEFMKILT